MATLDIVILVIVLLSCGLGLFRGLMREVLSLASWLAAFILAIYFAPSFAAQLDAQWGSESVRLIIGFAVIFIASLIVGGLVQWFLGKLIQSTGLSGTDRLLGFVFGGARGLLVCIVLLIGLRELAGDASWWHESQLQPQLLAFEDDVKHWLGVARDVIVEATDAPEAITI